ncbi:CBS domain containing-hemolysin-like protein [Bradymonas sediminis]|nr:CBS domain containing-hemolysin-like protein [Bradymonas sediminis]
MESVLPDVVGIVLCLLGSGLFSTTQTALNSLTESQARKLVEQKGSYALTMWRNTPDRVNSGLLIANTLSNLGAAALAAHGALILGGPYLTDPSRFGSLLAAAVATVAFLVLTFGEALPRTLGERRAQKVVAPMLTLTLPVQFLLSPLTFVFMGLSSALYHLIGEDEDAMEPSVTTEDLEHMLDQGSLEGSFGENGERLLRSVFEFSDTLVRELMVPRTDVVSLTIEMTFNEIIDELVNCGHSRLPVYEGSVDDVVGVFYAKDILSVIASGQADNFHLRDYMRRPYFVPEGKRVAQLLTEFQTERLHMAIVVDEFGGTSGVITLEDISEEIFGDIQDEYDVEPSQMVPIDDSHVRVDARTPIHEVEEFFGLELPDHPDYESLGGFLMSQVGGVPEPGHEVIWEGLRFRVLEADPKKVISVLIELINQSGDEPEQLVS